MSEQAHNPGPGQRPDGAVPSITAMGPDTGKRQRYGGRRGPGLVDQDPAQASAVIAVSRSLMSHPRDRASEQGIETVPMAAAAQFQGHDQMSAGEGRGDGTGMPHSTATRTAPPRLPHVDVDQANPLQSRSGSPALVPDEFMKLPEGNGCQSEPPVHGSESARAKRKRQKAAQLNLFGGIKAPETTAVASIAPIDGEASAAMAEPPVEMLVGALPAPVAAQVGPEPSWEESATTAADTMMPAGDSHGEGERTFVTATHRRDAGPPSVRPDETTRGNDVDVPVLPGPAAHSRPKGPESHGSNNPGDAVPYFQDKVGGSRSFLVCDSPRSGRPRAVVSPDRSAMRRGKRPDHSNRGTTLQGAGKNHTLRGSGHRALFEEECCPKTGEAGGGKDCGNKPETTPMEETEYSLFRRLIKGTEPNDHQLLSLCVRIAEEEQLTVGAVLAMSDAKRERLIAQRDLRNARQLAKKMPAAANRLADRHP